MDDSLEQTLERFKRLGEILNGKREAATKADDAFVATYNQKLLGTNLMEQLMITGYLDDYTKEEIISMLIGYAIAENAYNSELEKFNSDDDDRGTLQ